jgi:formate-dependent nitrite reductase membrane component NrfD
MEFPYYVMEFPGYQRWGWEIALYIFLGGVGSGALITAAVTLLLGKETKIARAGAYLAPPLLIVGSVLLLLDLAGIKAMLRAMLVPLTFTNITTSWMARGAWILLVTLLVAIAFAYSLATDKRYSRTLALLALPLGIATALYTGLLLKGARFVPLWNSGELPLLFLTSALTTGIAATLLLASVKEYSKLRGFLAALLVLLLIEAIEVPLYFFIIGEQGDIAVKSASAILSGAYSIAFWLVLMFLGIIIPILGLGYVLITRKAAALPAFFALVLLGGLTLRFLFVHGAIKAFVVPLI